MISSLPLHIQNVVDFRYNTEYYTFNAHFTVTEEYTFLDDSMKDVFPLTKDDKFSPNKKFT